MKRLKYNSTQQHLLNGLVIVPEFGPVEFLVWDALGQVELIASEWWEGMEGDVYQCGPDVREEKWDLEQGPVVEVLLDKHLLVSICEFIIYSQNTEMRQKLPLR